LFDSKYDKWGYPYTNLRNAKRKINIHILFRSIMKKEDIQYVKCAHCGARIPIKDAVNFKSVFIYGEHYHCRECDPKGQWDCMIDDVAMH
jgi:DNA-directed RNA polymerase subunit RPC12/RpoP